ncbi:MAG: DMT family transporter [Butyricicoccus sp.]|nr:DMT family transporter [Butyricicoccus sp.]
MKRHTIYILAAGTLWGFMGVFVRALAKIGISSTGAIMLRCGLAAVMLAVTILIRDRRLFAVRLRDFWCFIGTGLFSLLFFSYCYFTSMDCLDLGTAAVLLYTAPSIVMILSRFVFGEKLTGVKALALGLAFAGCCLVSGAGADTQISARGVLLGLGSGLGYALYSIFARLAMNRGYGSLTISFYTSLLAAVGAAAVWGTGEAALMFASTQNALLCIATAAVTFYLPYLLYTSGLEGVETGRASIMASVEPVVATACGILIFHETLTAFSACGTLLVLGAIVLLNVRPRRGGKNLA